MKVGQKICYVTWERGKGYSKESKEATLTYVGRQFFKTDAEPNTNKLISSIGKSCSSSDDRKEYFLSVSDINVFFEKIKLAQEVGEYLRFMPIDDLPLEKIKALHKILIH